MIALAPLTLIAFLAAPVPNASTSPAPAQPPVPSAPPSGASPFAACAPLPQITPGPPPFASAEMLSFDIDVTGAAAATMTMELLPRRGRGQSARQPILVQSSTNTFFAKVRQVKARLVSEIDVATTKLESSLVKYKTIDDVTEASVVIRDDILPKMTELRIVCDEAETVTAEERWPFPTYEKLLFSVK